MSDFTKEFKRLYKAYNKKLKRDHKINFKNLTNHMDYFVTYLKFMRDYYILTEPLILEDGRENLKIASLSTAVSEYELYQTCENNYYGFDGAKVVYKVEGTSEEVQQKYNLEKSFHWSKFWGIIKLHMEDWMPHA